MWSVRTRGWRLDAGYPFSKKPWHYFRFTDFPKIPIRHNRSAAAPVVNSFTLGTLVGIVKHNKEGRRIFLLFAFNCCRNVHPECIKVFSNRQRNAHLFILDPTKRIHLTFTSCLTYGGFSCFYVNAL